MYGFSRHLNSYIECFVTLCRFSTCDAWWFVNSGWYCFDNWCYNEARFATGVNILFILDYWWVWKALLRTFIKVKLLVSMVFIFFMYSETMATDMRIQNKKKDIQTCCWNSYTQYRKFCNLSGIFVHYFLINTNTTHIIC